MSVLLQHRTSIADMHLTTTRSQFFFFEVLLLLPNVYDSSSTVVIDNTEVKLSEGYGDTM